MNFNNVKTIFNKEFLEIFRDKRTLFTTFLLPLILYPILFIGLSSIMSRATTKLRNETKVIALENFDKYADSDNQEVSSIVSLMRARLEANELFKVYHGAEIIDTLITDKVIQCSIKIDSIAYGNPIQYFISYKYDGSDDKSEMTLRSLKGNVQNFEKDLLKTRIEKFTKKEIEDDFLYPLTNKEHVTEKNLARNEQMLGKVLGQMLPYLLLMLIVAAGGAVANDLVAGEKERKTLETLLVSSATRLEIVLGKFFTIMVASIVNVVMNLISLSFSFKVMFSQIASNMKSSGSNGAMSLLESGLPITSLLWVALTLIPFVALFSAILLMVSTYSRNLKESQTYFSPLMIIPMMCGMIAMIPGMSLNLGTCMIPIVNIAMLTKEILTDGLNMTHFLIVNIINIILSALAIYYSIKLFCKESVLFRTQSESSIKGLKKNKLQLLTPSIGIVMFFIFLGLFYYIGQAWQMEAFVDGKIDYDLLRQQIIKTQAILFGLPILLFVRFFIATGKNNKEKQKSALSFLRLNKFKPLNLVLVPLAAVPMIVISLTLTQLVNFVFPIPEGQYKAIEALMNGDGNVLPPLFSVIIAIAVVPAFFEEIMFRGFLFRFFEKKGIWNSIIIVALLFAVMHLDMYKLLVVFILGIWLCYLMYISKSTYVSMLGHFTNNLIAVFIARNHFSGFFEKLANSDGSANALTYITISGAIILAIGLNYLIYLVNKDKKIESI